MCDCFFPDHKIKGDLYYMFSCKDREHSRNCLHANDCSWWDACSGVLNTIFVEAWGLKMAALKDTSTTPPVFSCTGRHCSLIVEVKPIGGCSPNLSNVADTAEVICQELVSFPDLDTVGSDRVMGLDPFGSSWVVKFKLANLSSLMSLCQTSNLLSLHPSNRLPILPISVGTFRILLPRQEVKAEVKAIGSGPKISDLSVRLPSPSKLFERNHGQFLPGYRSARPQRREAFRRVVQACIKDTIFFLGLRDKHRVVAGDFNLEPHAIRHAVDCVIEQFEGASYEVLHGDRSAEICCVLLNFAKLPQLRGAVKSAVAERWTSQD